MKDRFKASADVKFEFMGNRHSRAYIDRGSPPLVLHNTEICGVDRRGKTMGALVYNPNKPDSPVQGKVAPTVFTKVHEPGQGEFTNCWSTPIWFFPAAVITSMVDDPQVAILYHGRVRRNENDIEILRTYQAEPRESSINSDNLTVNEVQIDLNTLLPVSIRFWRGSDGEAGVPSDPLSPSNNPVEVHYGDYQEVEGVKVPFHIVWSRPGAKGGLESVSIKIRAVRLNTGLSAGDFSVPSNLKKK
jgi:hypothetical protein